MNRREHLLDALGLLPEWLPRRADESIGVEDAAPLSRAVAEPPLESSASRAHAESANVEWAGQVPARVETAGAAGVTARATEILSLDWEPLARHVANCTACTLCERRTQTVFGVGDQQAEWLFVGEGPGEQEDLQGEPFVGQSGRLLDNMLRALGVSRQRNVYIANVVKCRPPGNRDPEPEEVAQCAPYLQRQIALLKPRLIVVLGKVAAHRLLSTDVPVSRLRGQVHDYAGIPVVVTYHPSYLLRSPNEKAKAWDDLCFAYNVHARSGDSDRHA